MKYHNIKLMDCVTGTSTNVEGVSLFVQLSKIIDEGNYVRLSLSNITPLSSSFLNSSFGELLDKYGFDKIKESVVLTDYRMKDAMKIKNYLEEIKSLG